MLESGPGTEWVAGRLEELQEELGAEAVVDPKAVASIMPEIDHLNIAEVDGNEMAAPAPSSWIWSAGEGFTIAANAS